MFVRSLIPWAGLRFFHLLRIEFRPQEIAMIGGEKKSRHSAVVTELDQVHMLTDAHWKLGTKSQSMILLLQDVIIYLTSLGLTTSILSLH